MRKNGKTTRRAQRDERTGARRLSSQTPEKWRLSCANVAPHCTTLPPPVCLCVCVETRHSMPSCLPWDPLHPQHTHIHLPPFLPSSPKLDHPNRLSDWCSLLANGSPRSMLDALKESRAMAHVLHLDPWKELKWPTWRHQTLYIPLYGSHMAADLIFFLPQQGIKLATNLDCEYCR